MRRIIASINDETQICQVAGQVGAPAFVERACAYDWPGNVRELENVVARALLMSRGGWLDAGDWFAVCPADAAAGAEPSATLVPLEQVEASQMRRTLAATRWQICGLITEDLKTRKFNGDFDAMLAWWRLNKETEHQALATAGAAGSQCNALSQR